ncbi:unnamed protein product [Adineta ricciae]|uniref:Uncharacterized protein n=1 Tax=Adineta ricciae TaxID=249248 RepID=A0A816CKZ9_ADIRI|nr:unnamed protein product [Adineta ricciae]
MLMKGSLLFLCTILLLNCMEFECRAIRCFSCSDCANSTLAANDNFITTTRDTDRCMKTTILTSKSGQRQQLISRGASSNCAQTINHIIAASKSKVEFNYSTVGALFILPLVASSTVVDATTAPSLYNISVKYHPIGVLLRPFQQGGYDDCVTQFLKFRITRVSLRDWTFSQVYETLFVEILYG